MPRYAVTHKNYGKFEIEADEADLTDTGALIFWGTSGELIRGIARGYWTDIEAVNEEVPDDETPTADTGSQERTPHTALQGVQQRLETH